MSKISALSLLLLSYGLALPITTARPLSHDRDFVSNVVQLHQHAFPVATTFDQNNVETALPGITEVLAGKTIIDFDIPIAASPATKKQNNVPLFIATDWVEALDSRRSSQTHSTHSETRVNGWYTTCPDGLDACATADGQSWECIDTQNDPTQCGGCTRPLETYAPVGLDCLALSGRSLDSPVPVTCQLGVCHYPS